MRHTRNEIEKSFDVLKEAFEDVSECTGCIVFERNRENMSGSQGCDLCRSGKQIIVYGVDYALDTKSEYHRIEPKYCPVCGRKLEDSHDKD